MADNSKKRPGQDLERDFNVIPKKRPGGRSAEGIQSKKENDRLRRQTRICIGIAFDRWRALKEKVGFRADTDLALLLLDR